MYKATIPNTQVKCGGGRICRSMVYAILVVTIATVAITEVNDATTNVVEGLFLNDRGFLVLIMKIMSDWEMIPNANQNVWNAVDCSGVLIPNTKYNTTKHIISKIELSGPNIFIKCTSDSLFNFFGLSRSSSSQLSNGIPV